MFKKRELFIFWIKMTNWEYWSFHMLYGPIYLYWIWLGIRTGAPFFFNVSNPLIKNGGFLMESKKDIYDLIPPQFYPKTIIINPDTPWTQVQVALINSGISFPMIAKPDIGMRGIAVQKLSSLTDLEKYASKTKVAFLIQDFVELEQEVGIFYVRIPNENKGRITGIVSKEFLTITGDGVSNLYNLMQQDSRSILQIPHFQKNEPSILNRVLNKGESYLLVPYGNHARGAKFIDSSHLTTPELTETIDQICQQIPHFYFGRLDIRYKDWESLCKGANLSIIELNGAGSEPTHIYDPKHSVFFAWGEIIRHWKLLRKISVINHQKMNIPYMTISEGISMLQSNAAHIRLLENS